MRFKIVIRSTPKDSSHCRIPRNYGSAVGESQAWFRFAMVRIIVVSVQAILLVSCSLWRVSALAQVAVPREISREDTSIDSFVEPGHELLRAFTNYTVEGSTLGAGVKPTVFFPAPGTPPLDSKIAAYAGKYDTAASVSFLQARGSSAKGSPSVQWRRYFQQEFMEVSFQMGERLITESKTRSELRGSYFKDWFYVIQHYRYSVWNDGDKFFTSNIGHPAQGAILESIFWQNDDRVRFHAQDFRDPKYRHALVMAAALCTSDAVQWKLGPFSEATIGHVGLPTREQGFRNRTGMNDLVLNAAGGTIMLMGFQWLDKHVQKPLESRMDSAVAINTLRIFTNPPGSLANIFRLRTPWYRDDR